MYKIFIKKLRDKIKNDVHRYGNSNKLQLSFNETAVETKKFVSTWLLVEQNDFFDIDEPADLNLHGEKLPEVEYSFAELIEKGFQDALAAVQKELTPIQAANYKKIIQKIKDIYTNELNMYQSSQKKEPEETKELEVNPSVSIIADNSKIGTEEYLNAASNLIDSGEYKEYLNRYNIPNIEKTALYKKLINKIKEDFKLHWSDFVKGYQFQSAKKLLNPAIDDILHSKNIDFKSMLQAMEHEFHPYDDEKSLFTPAQVNWALTHFNEENHPELKNLAEKVKQKLNQAIESANELEGDVVSLFNKLEDYFNANFKGDKLYALEEYNKWIMSIIENKNNEAIKDARLAKIAKNLQDRGIKDKSIQEYLYDIGIKIKNPPDISKVKNLKNPPKNSDGTINIRQLYEDNKSDPKKLLAVGSGVIKLMGGYDKVDDETIYKLSYHQMITPDQALYFFKNSKLSYRTKLELKITIDTEYKVDIANFKAGEAEDFMAGSLLDIFNAHKEQGVNKFLDERKNKITAEEAGQLVNLPNVLSPRRAFDILLASKKELNNKIDEETFNRFLSKVLTDKTFPISNIGFLWRFLNYDNKYFSKQIKNEIEVNEFINNFEKNNYLKVYSIHFPEITKEKLEQGLKEILNHDKVETNPDYDNILGKSLISGTNNYYVPSAIFQIHDLIKNNSYKDAVNYLRSAFRKILPNEKGTCWSSLVVEFIKLLNNKYGSATTKKWFDEDAFKFKDMLRHDKIAPELKKIDEDWYNKLLNKVVAPPQPTPAPEVKKEDDVPELFLSDDDFSLGDFIDDDLNKKENTNLQTFLNKKKFKHPYLTILENIYLKGHVKDVYIESIQKHIDNNNFYAACNMAIIDVQNQLSSLVMNENYNPKHIAYGDEKEIQNNLNIINHYFTRNLLTPEIKAKHPDLENIINKITGHILSKPFINQNIGDHETVSQEYHNQFVNLLNKFLSQNQVSSVTNNLNKLTEKDKKYLMAKAQNQPEMTHKDLIFLQKFLTNIKT